ncbi:hypothetical protein K2173_021958 [Erythroxylum novogranatense]|uniref:Uncharacterized protein n=1 Tax=Erythroxylum novogranatense TaxID=1862640 RepID=A0AAV8T3R8_9ROSI|nr:hypothetical protein K2173_021958 [Erythroxylum novogranatense]
MKKYFKKLRPTLQSSSCDLNQNVNKAPPASKEVIIEELVIDLENLPSDPGLRLNIMAYPLEKRDQVPIDLIDIMLRFEFLFMLHLMIKILGITNGLSQVLQKKDENIVNAMHLVKVSKFVDFCGENNVSEIDMQDKFIVRGRSRRRSEDMTNLHHYRIELFYSVIDMQLQELNNRFDEVNTSLLLCMAYLDPKDSFYAFDMDKLIELAKFYPSEFPPIALIELEYQLENFIIVWIRIKSQA